MIVTRKQHVPWSWVVLSQLPFVFWMFTTCFQGTAITFSLQKFTSNPALIATTISLASLPVILIAPVINYLSDRIWTRFGRRKPFYVIGNTFCALFLLLMPFARNYWTFTALLTGYFIGTAFGKTFFPLSQEVIPLMQRGRGSAIHTLMFQLGILVFYALVLGRFDDLYTTGPLAFLGPVTGEQFLYCAAALACLFSCLIVALGITELPLPVSSIPDSSAGRSGWLEQILGFFRDIFDRQWAILYLLLFSGALYGLGLGSLAGLLYTEQWGYSKQDLGTNVAIGTLIILPFIFLFGFVADKFDKMNLYLAAISAAVVFNIGYYIFVMFILPDHRPALWQIILFGEFIAIAGNFAATVQWPLIFEFIPRAKIGTASAGMEMMNALFSVILAPLIGFWVTVYSGFFLPPSGAEVRVMLSTPLNETQLRESIQSARTRDSAAFSLLSPKQLSFQPWFPPNAAFPKNLIWDIRLTSPESARTDEQRKILQATIADLQKSQSRSAGENSGDTSLEIARREVLKLNTELDLMTSSFAGQIQRALDPHLTRASVPPVKVHHTTLRAWRIPVRRRLSPDEIHSLNLHLLTMAPPGAMLRHHVQEDASTELRLLLPQELADSQVRKLVLTLLTPPILNAPGLSNGLVTLQHDSIWDGFQVDIGSVVHAKESSLWEIADRLEEEYPLYFSIRPGSDPGVIRVTLAVSLAAHVNSSPEESGNLSIITPNSSPATLTRWKAAWPVLKTALDTQGAPVQQPILRKQFMPHVYDYFSAYLATILGGLVGIGIVLWIKRLERLGLILRHGVIEDREAAAVRNESAR